MLARVDRVRAPVLRAPSAGDQEERVAERVGFEPTVALRRHAISSRAQSASLASLRQSTNRRRRHDNVDGAPAERRGWDSNPR